MRILKTWATAFVAIAALAGCGREGGAAATDGEAKAVQVYEVPPAQLQSVQQALDMVLRVDEIGSVTSSGGRLVVLAPSSTQASIDKAIATLSSQQADAGPVGEAP